MSPADQRSHFLAERGQFYAVFIRTMIPPPFDERFARSDQLRGGLTSPNGWNAPIGDPTGFVADLQKHETRIILSHIFRM